MARSVWYNFIWWEKYGENLLNQLPISYGTKFIIQIEKFDYSDFFSGKCHFEKICGNFADLRKENIRRKLIDIFRLRIINFQSRWRKICSVLFVKFIDILICKIT